MIKDRVSHKENAPCSAPYKVNSPKVSRNVKFSRTNFVYELSRDLLNDLRLRIL